MDFLEKLKSMSREQRRNLAYGGGLSCGKTAMQAELLRFYQRQMDGVERPSIFEVMEKMSSE